MLNYSPPPPTLLISLCIRERYLTVLSSQSFPTFPLTGGGRGGGGVAISPREILRGGGGGNVY